MIETSNLLTRSHSSLSQTTRVQIMILKGSGVRDIAQQNSRGGVQGRMMFEKIRALKSGEATRKINNRATR